MGTTIFSKPLENDVSGKADKVASATSGNFAALDSNGNLTDSGHKHSDYLTSHQDISGKQDKTDSNLTTTATTVVGAINEHETDIIALNSKNANHELGSFSTVASLETALTTAISGMSANETKWISFTFTATTGVFHYAKYRGYILRSTGATPSAGAAIVLNTGVYDACGYYNGSSYTWNGLVDKFSNYVKNAETGYSAIDRVCMNEEGNQILIFTENHLYTIQANKNW